MLPQRGGLGLQPQPPFRAGKSCGHEGPAGVGNVPGDCRLPTPTLFCGIPQKGEAISLREKPSGQLSKTVNYCFPDSSMGNDKKKREISFAWTLGENGLY